MQPPDELMVDEFLPAMRQLVARSLRAQGLSQNRISSLLGMTQASVSLYLSSDSTRSYSALSGLSLSAEEADRYAALLAEDAKRNAVDAVGTLSKVWTGLLGRGAVCPRHRSMYPALADCDVCIMEYGKDGSALSEAVSEVAEAIQRLEATSGFVSVMPEVSVNLALAVGDAESAADVVAVPGRIVKVKGRAKAILPPEPGASRHLSRVLLLVRKKKPEFRACINLRFDSKMVSVLKKLKLRSLEIGGYLPSSSGDPTIQALEKRLTSSEEDFDVLVDIGGKGVEPNLYLFARNAADAAGLALRVSQVYSSR
jgi:predicted fused transcriptional regulator/phosphomethylpyrimidine kinase/predicted transcriptional regulator